MRRSEGFFFCTFHIGFTGVNFLRILTGMILFVVMSSCNRGKEEKPSSDKLVQDEIRNINWNEVDQYPLFETCDETAEKIRQKACFEKTFVRYLYAGIEDQQVVMHGSVDDTIYVRFLISGTGKISVAEIEQKEKWEKHVPGLDSIVAVSLKKMPVLHPALKRNIPVATKYRLPVVLQSATVSSPGQTH
ncbi:hypothetical protein [Sinomicrobium sp. M5D2P9]